MLTTCIKYCLIGVIQKVEKDTPKYKLIKGVDAYIKITIQNGELLVVISFKKRKQNG